MFDLHQTPVKVAVYNLSPRVLDLKLRWCADRPHSSV